MEGDRQIRSLGLCVRAIVRNEGGQVLLVRRRPDAEYEPGAWEFPGGKANAGEPFDAALIREVEEETSLKAGIERAAGSIEMEHKGQRSLCLLFECRSGDGDVVVGTEHEGFRWVTMSELADLAASQPGGPGPRLTEAIRPAVREYCASKGYGPSPKAAPPAEPDRVPKLLPTWIKQFTEVRPRYEQFAKELEDVLRSATRRICPQAIVQTRVKELPSFSEKILRKGKYQDPLVEMTDLCGARVIVHTQDEVKRVCAYVEATFDIDWKNSLDMRSRLGAAQFGYRGIHYVLSFRPGGPLSVPEDLLGLKAEVQVRTIPQHAWSEVGHDRVYKSPFRPPEQCERENARIAALLEDADEAFSRLVEGVERYRCDFGVYMTPERVQQEIKIAETILAYDAENADLAHRLARLHIAAGQWSRAADVAAGFADHPGLLCCRGMSLCHLHRPGEPEYALGRQLCEKASEKDPKAVEPLIRLAESSADPKDRLLWFERAFGVDPTCPAALAGYIRSKMEVDRTAQFIPLLRPSIRSATRLCEDQVAVGVNLPWALYAIAAFHLLLGSEHERECLEALARAIHVRQPRFHLENALADAEMLDAVQPGRPALRCVIRMIRAALAAHADTTSAARYACLSGLGTGIKPPVVIVAGACDPAHTDRMDAYRRLLQRAFADFRGTIISGGTKQGVAGLVAELGAAAPERLYTIGYLPATLPTDGTAERDERYHEIRRTEGQGAFSPLEPIQNWLDMLVSGVRPSDVCVVGINGGPIAAFEYRLAWALGARVGIVRDSGREADLLQDDVLRDEYPGMLILPEDSATVRAFLRPQPTKPIEPEDRERLARIVHARFLREGRHAVADPTMRPWEELDQVYRDSNLDQMSYMISILDAVGLRAERASYPVPLLTLTDAEVEVMAELEHGRWNVERLSQGWRYGEKRDVANRVHNCLVGWEKLEEASPGAKQWDRNSVRRFPELVAEVGLEVVRGSSTP